MKRYIKSSIELSEYQYALEVYQYILDTLNHTPNFFRKYGNTIKFWYYPTKEERDLYGDKFEAIRYLANDWKRKLSVFDGVKVTTPNNINSGMSLVVTVPIN